MVTGARNPIGLCYIGEMVVDVQASHPHEFVSDVPFRLVAGRVCCFPAWFRGGCILSVLFIFFFLLHSTSLASL